MRTTVADLFDPPPGTWGLRGDPHLWAELRAHFADTPLPADEPALLATLTAAFAAATGIPLTATGLVHVPRLSHGGMSSGCVFPPWWRGTGVPLLLARAAASRG